MGRLLSRFSTLILLSGILLLTPTRASADGGSAPATGSLVVAVDMGAARSTQLLAIHVGQPPHVLVTVPAPIKGLAASPRGRYVALAAGARGLWLLNVDGTGLRRIASVPRSGSGTLEVAAVAWSPDRYTIAYIVDDGNVSRPMDRSAGIWTIRYDGGMPRQVAHGDFGRAGTPATSLSWSSEGRTIVAVGRAGVTAIDAATGRARVLAAQDTSDGSVQAAAAASTATTVCYVRLLAGSQAIAYTLYVADADGGHARRLLQISNTITSPAWVPDGRSIAYLWQHGPTEGGYRSPVEIHAVDVASGRTRVLLGPRASNQGAIQSFAWLPVKS